MVAKTSSDGLIVATRARATQSLTELAECCGWPMLCKANARALRTELSFHLPACVLFWLDDSPNIAPTVQLMAWLRDREAKPIRIAVATEQAGNAEPVLRAAGAHSVLSINGHSGAAIAEALGQLLQHADRQVEATAAGPVPTVTTSSRLTHMDVPPQLVRPP
jgi:hypothetical protein